MKEARFIFRWISIFH